MNALRYRLGFALRETGQAMERLGATLQGINSFQEHIPQLKPVLHAGLKLPEVASTTWIAPSAQVVGEVTVGDNCSIWYNCTVRGDSQPVSIGHNSNLQDGVSVGSLRPEGPGTKIGNWVSVGHNAVLQSCTVQDRSLIGMNAVLQDGATVETGAMVAAGAVVSAGAVVPSGELWGGNPARRLRALKPEEDEYLKNLPQRYQELAAEHRDALALARAKMDRLAGGALDGGLAAAAAARQ
ncbi:MAG: trimeric LpxA-like protein [Monoraphidium minutum]|nr:MAG: trimeric LpxA-like protein [Monoraphidium minutum]